MRDASDWQEIQELFFAAEGMTPSERAAFLDGRCAERDDLRRAVEKLLVADNRTGDMVAEIVGRAAVEHFVDQPTEAVPTEDASSEAVPTANTEPEAGERIGPYRLIRVLGQGGMGTVYLAERVDGEYESQVAIKVIRGGLSLGEARRRFLQERQILARLNHPAVARLFDGGTTVAGSPYLVMEYIDGLPIDVYCDHHRLSIRQRLELFAEICQAVDDAHGNLVVHRDLKPSNILVTEDGRPKLLDFGISKLLDSHHSETAFGQRVLTPEYASPEQIRDQPITTAVDIYALGLLLHRLLTGTRPYPVKPTTSAEWFRTICEVEPERPSVAVRRLAKNEGDDVLEGIANARAVSPSHLLRRLAGDLDHIVTKALRKEPRERYRSVDRLAADIRRHLQGLPVEARRGGFRYRAVRFVRRHRTPVVAALVAFFSLAFGLLGQAREAQRANREAIASAQVVDFLTDLFNASDPVETLDTTTVADLLHRAVERVQSELEGQPQVQARLMSTLGRVYHNRGLFEEALPLFRGALERRQAVLPAGDPQIATTHLDLADDLRVLGQLDEAMPHYEKALQQRERHFGSDSLEVAQVLNNMALGWIHGAESARAASLLTRALEIRRRELGRHYLVTQCLHNLTLIALRRGDYRQAESRARETLEIKAEVLPPRHPSTGRTMTLLAQALRELGDYAEAERTLTQAIEILREVWGDEHLDVLAAVGDRAELRSLQGDTSAEAEQRRVLALKREYLGPRHREVAISLVALGAQLRDEGRLVEAEALLREALDIRREVLVEGHPSTARTMLALAETLRLAGRFEESVSLADQGMRWLVEGLPPGHPDIAEGRRVQEACRAAAQANQS